jgi:hypothetical protein
VATPFQPADTVKAMTDSYNEKTLDLGIEQTAEIHAIW